MISNKGVTWMIQKPKPESAENWTKPSQSFWLFVHHAAIVEDGNISTGVIVPLLRPPDSSVGPVGKWISALIKFIVS